MGNIHVSGARSLSQTNIISRACVRSLRAKRAELSDTQQTLLRPLVRECWAWFHCHQQTQENCSRLSSMNFSNVKEVIAPILRTASKRVPSLACDVQRIWFVSKHLSKPRIIAIMVVMTKMSSLAFWVASGASFLPWERRSGRKNVMCLFSAIDLINRQTKE